MNIGLIAMSGVRAHNPELTELGLTLPGFVDRNRIIASMPSLSLLTLAGMTSRRHRLEYHEIADLRRLPELPTHFDLVAISTFSAQAYEAYEAAQHYTRRGIPVVMGGLHVTSTPDEARDYDVIPAIGEGELLWPQIVADAERGQLRPSYRSAPGAQFDLRDAPMPRFDLLDPAKYNRITVQTSRGCPHKCEFCASSILLTNKYKLKPADKVIAEIHAIKEIWPKPFVELADDNSFVDRRHYKELLRRMIPEDVRWFTETDISVAEDDELLGLLRDSGCQQILIGLESPRRESLHGVERVSDWKMRRLERYRAAIEKIQSYGVTVNGCFILGLDGDTPEIFEDVLQFVRESGLYEVQVTFMTAFPNTPLYHRLKAEKRIIRDRAWELCTLFDINFLPKQMSADQLQSGFLKLVKELYSADETSARRRAFKHRLKDSPNFHVRKRPHVLQVKSETVLAE